MSNRTSEANKAIALAWSKEQQLISEGKGTRDWTPEQQQNILARGKAYGDDGKAFEGHHMKSAERFPEYQGDLENIQFLSRPEHFAAHDGNFKNSTNGFFNPHTGETIDFGSNKYEPCEIFELSEPVIISGNQSQNATETSDASPNTRMSDANTEASIPTSLKILEKSGFGSTAKYLAGKVAKFYVRHKKIIDPVVTFFELIVVVVIKETLIGSSKSNSNAYDEADDYATYYSPPEASGGGIDSFQQEDMIERSSPDEHTVSAHRQRYYGQWKEKAPYKRGKNSDD